MSRFSDDDGPEYNNAYELWQWNLIRALGSRRGQQALRDMREALLALPEKRLIARALCTVGDGRRPEPRTLTDGRILDYAGRDFDEIIEEQGRGVCAVGAFAWYAKVKSGVDPAQAFAELPTLEDTNYGAWETAAVGAKAGLARTLAAHLAYKNDETWRDLDPEERWQKCMDWVDAQLATSVVSS